jgi:hypothetical protein
MRLSDTKWLAQFFIRLFGKFEEDGGRKVESDREKDNENE